MSSVGFLSEASTFGRLGCWAGEAAQCGVFGVFVVDSVLW